MCLFLQSVLSFLDIWIFVFQLFGEMFYYIFDFFFFWLISGTSSCNAVVLDVITHFSEVLHFSSSFFLSGFWLQVQ